MMLYDIFSRRDRGFDSAVRLRPPLDPTEWAENKNWDYHLLYADRVDGALVWRSVDALTEVAQRRHGVGSIVEAEARRARRVELERAWTLAVDGAAPVRVQMRAMAGARVRVAIDGETREYCPDDMVAALECDPPVREAWRRLRAYAYRLVDATIEHDGAPSRGWSRR